MLRRRFNSALFTLALLSVQFTKHPPEWESPRTCQSSAAHSDQQQFYQNNMHDDRSFALDSRCCVLNTDMNTHQHTSTTAHNVIHRPLRRASGAWHLPRHPSHPARHRPWHWSPQTRIRWIACTHDGGKVDVFQKHWIRVFFVYVTSIVSIQ